MRQKVFNWGAVVTIAVIVANVIFRYGVLTEKVNELQRTVTSVELQLKQLQAAR